MARRSWPQSLFDSSDITNPSFKEKCLPEEEKGKTNEKERWDHRGRYRGWPFAKTKSGENNKDPITADKLARRSSYNCPHTQSALYLSFVHQQRSCSSVFPLTVSGEGGGERGQCFALSPPKWVKAKMAVSTEPRAMWVNHMGSGFRQWEVCGTGDLIWGKVKKRSHVSRRRAQSTLTRWR